MLVRASASCNLSCAAFRVPITINTETNGFFFGVVAATSFFAHCSLIFLFVSQSTSGLTLILSLPVNVAVDVTIDAEVAAIMASLSAVSTPLIACTFSYVGVRFEFPSTLILLENVAKIEKYFCCFGFEEF